MAEKESENQATRMPQGFTIHSAGPASEKARELGWGINEEERTNTTMQKQAYDGGKNYDYGPRNFGDTAVDTSSIKPAAADRSKARPGRPKKTA